MDGHFDCVQVCATVNKIATNIHAQVFVCTHTSTG